MDTNESTFDLWTFVHFFIGLFLAVIVFERLPFIESIGAGVIVFVGAVLMWELFEVILSKAWLDKNEESGRNIIGDFAAGFLALIVYLSFVLL